MANPHGGSAQVAANLSSSTNDQPLREEHAGQGGDALTAEVHQAPTHTAEARAFGFDTTGWVAIASLLVLVIMLVKGVPRMIGASLDARIADIRRQLDDAQRLRAEAEALRVEYQAKAAAAHQDAETVRAHAHNEAHAIIAKAKRDAEDLMARRAKMAEDKIAAAERTATAEVRAAAADTAVKAAALLMREQLDAGADRALVDRTISGLGGAAQG